MYYKCTSFTQSCNVEYLYLPIARLLFVLYKFVLCSLIYIVRLLLYSSRKVKVWELILLFVVNNLVLEEVGKTI